MFKHVLIACMGNICRSPMAEYFLKERVPDIEVFSAGLNAVVGKAAEATAIKIMKEQGIDMTSHCAQQLNTFLLSRADLVLVMENSHIDIIHNEFPSSRGKVFLLGKWLDNKPIPDPYQSGEEAFRDSLKLIEKGIDNWQQKIWKGSNVKQRYSYN